MSDTTSTHHREIAAELDIAAIRLDREIRRNPRIADNPYMATPARLRAMADDRRALADRMDASAAAAAKPYYNQHMYRVAAAVLREEESVIAMASDGTEREVSSIEALREYASSLPAGIAIDDVRFAPRAEQMAE